LSSSVLISGTLVFVGKHLSAYFKSTYPKMNLIELNRSSNNQQNSINWDQIKNLELPDVSSFIHLTGLAHDTKKTNSESKYFEINTDLTVLLFEKFLQSNATQFIYMSSVKAAADQVNTELFETIDPNPKTAYGKSKLLAEQKIQNLYATFMNNHPHSQKKYYILRPCMIHGPGNKGNLNLLVNFVNKGIPYPFAAFENKRSFLSIDNLVFVIGKIIERNIDSGIYNVSDDQAISTNELVQMIGETYNKKIKLLKIPIFFIRALFGGLDILNAKIGSEQLNKMVENYQVNNSKILKALDVKLPVSTKEGLKTTIFSFQNN